jgi:Zn-finger nucleic acid-binding protein
MCGGACSCNSAIVAKGKSTGKKSESSVQARNENEKAAGFAIIPTQNKGLCTMCDVNVWVVVSTGLEIKWCKGCKNFRPWAAFGDKGLATKCLRCRERQREKYALQKEEKDKQRSTKTSSKVH